MGKGKIDQVLDEIKAIRTDIQSLKEGQKKLEDGQQRNYGLIQKNGVTIEQVASDVRGVADGHGVLLNRIEEVKGFVKEVDNKLEETRRVVGDTNKMLKEHIRLPLHAV